MKKYIVGLVALMVVMTTFVLTSCSNDVVNETEVPEVTIPGTGTHVETLIIDFPDQTQTRLTMDDNHNLTGWEEGDEVTLAQINIGSACTLEDTYTFKCTDAEKGIFTGTMKDGVSVNDCQIALYNAAEFSVNKYWGRLNFSPKTRASQNMKDVVMLVAKNDGEGHFAMDIYGSILEVTNNTGADITAGVKYKWQNICGYYDCSGVEYENGNYTYSATDINIDQFHPITLSSEAPTYVHIPVVTGNPYFAVGLSAEDDEYEECSIVPYKTDPSNAKLFKKTLEPQSTGKAKRTGDIKVNWVQLWENGPKFAEYNIGAENNRAEDYGYLYAWGGNQDRIDDHYTDLEVLTGDFDTAINLWGSNWRMPTKDELDALVKSCDIVWTTVNGVDGCKFTGKGDYASNSIFLPFAGRCEGGNVDFQTYFGNYWSSTPSDSDFSYQLEVSRNPVNIYSATSRLRSRGLSVRAVLAESPATTGTGKATIGGTDVLVRWVQLWKNGPKFAKYNVGVTDGKAESYGAYYAWGGFVDVNGTSGTSTWNNGSSMLTGDADTATKLWGNEWRMPTGTELDDLLDNCDVEWTTVNGVNGRKYTGRGDYASNSVFLPAAGYYSYTNKEIKDLGDYGCYWSSSPVGSTWVVYDLYFYSGAQEVSGSTRENGLTVRAVLKE